MITPYLEQLIIEGRAIYKTFVAGYSQKHIMTIPENRYIILTDLWYTPTLYYDPRLAENPDPLIRRSIDVQFKNNMITQLTILGDRGFNRFLFKNSITKDFLPVDPLKPLEELSFYSANNPIHISCYLIHTNGISFTFSNTDKIIASPSAIAPFEVPALPDPTDYGKDGITTAINTISNLLTVSLFENDFHGQKLTSGTGGNNEFCFPVNTNTNLDATLKAEKISYPILNVGYVEILGQPKNSY
jgi:hypothetical protein